MHQRNWGTFSWTRGLETGREVVTLREVAAKGGNDLLAVVNYLLRLGTEDAEEFAEALFDQYA